MEQGEWLEGEAILLEAIEKMPYDPVPRTHLAESLWKRGAQDQAIEQITTAARLSPNDAAIAVRAGEMLLGAGSAKAAADQAARAVKLNSKLATTWALRGQAYAAQGLDDRALADYQHALLLAPNNTDVLLALGSLYNQRQQHQRCLVTLHRLLDSYPPGKEPVEALMLEGQTYLALNRPAEATACLALAVERGPTTAELRLLQAHAELALGRPRQAEDLARQALLVDSKHEPARQLLLRLGQQTGPTTSSLH